jgi:hypothetical protein
LCLAGTARAQVPDRSRVVVLIIPGSGGDRARDVVATALRDPYEVLGPEEWEKAAGRLGETPGGSRAEVARIAPELAARAVFTGNVAPRADGQTLTLIARDGKSGEILESARFRMRGYDFAPATVKEVEEFALRAARQGKAGKPTLPPLPPPPPPEIVAAPPPAPVERLRPSWESLVDAALGLGLVGRSFSQGTGNDYGFFPVAAFQIRADVWPLARHGTTWLGLGLGYGQVFSINSDVKDAAELPSCRSLPSTLRSLDLGVRARWNPSRSEHGPTLRGQLGWGLLIFGIDGEACDSFRQADGRPLIPDVTHELMRLGLGARLPVGPEPLALQGDLVYLHAFGDSGGVGGDGGNGVELSAGADWRLAPAVQAGLRVGYTRIGVDAPADNLVGTATDQYLSILAQGIYSY